MRQGVIVCSPTWSKLMARATAKYYPSLGSVSEGTLLTEDLLDTFAYELRYHIKRMALTREQRKRFNALIKEAQHWLKLAGGKTPACGPELVDELQDALNEIAPPYAYFGACEGDGACFGFWPMMQGDWSSNDLPMLDIGKSINREHWGEDVYLVNDHGNVDCG